MSRIRSGLVVLGALAVVLVGCSSSSSPQLPTSGAGPGITKWANQKYGASATVGAVKCPQKTVPMKQGFTFICTVDIDRVPVRLVLTEINTRGQVHWAQSEAVIITKKAEDVVESYANGHGRPTLKVSCGRTSVMTRKPGQKISCRMTYANGSRGSASVGVKDTNSNVVWLGFKP